MVTTVHVYVLLLQTTVNSMLESTAKQCKTIMKDKVIIILLLLVQTFAELFIISIHIT